MADKVVDVEPAIAAMLKEKLNAFLEVSDDDLPMYFQANMNNILSLKRQDITEALEARDNSHIMNEIRNGLLPQANQLFPELTDRIPIKRQKMEKLCDDIYTLAHCILVKNAGGEPDPVTKNWLYSVYRNKPSKTMPAQNNTLQSTPDPIQNGDRTKLQEEKTPGKSNVIIKL